MPLRYESPRNVTFYAKPWPPAGCTGFGAWGFWELESWRGEEGDSVASAAPALRPAAAWNPLMPQKRVMNGAPGRLLVGGLSLLFILL